MLVILIKNITFLVIVLQADKHFPFRKLLRRFLELSYPGKFGRWRTAHKKGKGMPLSGLGMCGHEGTN
jgi:hypothetical protein